HSLATSRSARTLAATEKAPRYKIMNKIVILGIALVLCSSCKPYKFTFVPTSQASYAKLNQGLEKANLIGEDSLFLGFTQGFNNENIIITTHSDTIFKGTISTDGKKFAKAFKIYNQVAIKVKFNREKDSFEITEKQMRLYKFIYIERA